MASLQQLTPHDQHYVATLKDWQSQGADIYIGGTAVGALAINEDMTKFSRDSSRSFSSELKQVLKDELGAENAQLNLQKTQTMLTTMDRYPAGIHRAHVAVQDRLQANNDDEEDLPEGPTPG